MAVINGELVAQNILEELKAKVAKLASRPVLAVILVGDNRASLSYINRKKAAAETVGITFQLFHFPAEITEGQLLAEIKTIQANPAVNGLIVQLPLPAPIDTKTIINAIDPKIDVDCLTEVNLKKLEAGEPYLVPPTAGAIVEILKRNNVDYTDKKVVLVGQGQLVGQPLSLIMKVLNVPLTVCTASTPDLAAETKQADILITGVGKANLITGEMVKDGVVVIDAGFSFVDGKSYGDVEFASVSPKANLITPTPGGVGPVTVAMLLENVVEVAS